jgi:hypothetical protein
MNSRVVLVATLALLTVTSYAYADTITGCLSGPTSQGVYLLSRNKKTPKKVAVGGSSELGEHVGHLVELTGDWANSGADIGEKGEEPAVKHGHFKVSAIKHLSDKCHK